MDLKSATAGMTVTMHFTDGPPPTDWITETNSCTFTAGGSNRFAFDDGPPGPWVMVNGDITFADGTEAWALFVLDESSNGEMWDWGVFVPAPVNGIVFRSEYGSFENPSDGLDEYCAALGKRASQIWPFEYRITSPLGCVDVHTLDLKSEAARYMTAIDAAGVVLSNLQRRILKELEGRAMTADDLQHGLNVGRNTLFGRNGSGGALNELMQLGLVTNDRKVGGYFRPDARPDWD